MGIAATSHQIAVEGISIDRMVDGKSAEAWTIVDVMGMMR